FHQSSLGPDPGLSFVAALPKGAVQVGEPILEERWSAARACSVTPLTGGLSLLAAVLLLGWVAWLMWTRGRDRRFTGSPVDAVYGSAEGDQPVPLFERGAVPVEFQPPDGLRPGQVGTLQNEAANPLDVTATIVDLAVRGYLRIEEIPKKHFWGKPDWRLVQLKEPDQDLLDYERILFGGLFEDAEATDDQEVAETVPPRP